MNLKKFLKSFSYAIDGLSLSVKVDQNVRIHLGIGILVLILCFFLKINGIELLFIIFSIFFVLITEMVNTSIEEMTNLIKKEHSEEARIAKDVAAGSVLLAALFSVIVAIVIILPKILVLI